MGQADFCNASSDHSFCEKRLNGNAPEFVPTLSANCPVVGMGIVAVENGHCAKAVTLQVHSCLGLRHSHSSQSLSKDAAPRRSKLAARRQRCVSHLPIEPNRGVCDVQVLSEEDWARRIETRLRAIRVAKETREYQSFSRANLLREREAGDPTTPDPRDRSISVHKWKYQVQQWRAVLSKRWDQDAHRSVVSTEDCASDIASSAATDDF